jgi:hypothetical protein
MSDPAACEVCGVILPHSWCGDLYLWFCKDCCNPHEKILREQGVITGIDLDYFERRNGAYWYPDYWNDPAKWQLLMQCFPSLCPQCGKKHP